MRGCERATATWRHRLASRGISSGRRRCRDAGPGLPNMLEPRTKCLVVSNLAGMLFAALRDMRWRMRRLVIAVVSTGLIFAMTLVLTGLSNGFHVEAQRTVDSIGVDTFLIKAGAAGPFLGATPFAEAELAQVANAPGVLAAAPLACAPSTVKDGSSARNVTAFGAPADGLGMPRVSEGRAPSTPDEVAVS